MTRILVSMPDDLHDLLRELALRNKTSMSKLILGAIEDAYEDEIDAIAGERALTRHLADSSSSISWDELKLRLRAQANASKQRRGINGTKPKRPKDNTNIRARKTSGVQS
jgi:hypothetical protein